VLLLLRLDRLLVLELLTEDVLLDELTLLLLDELMLLVLELLRLDSVLVLELLTDDVLLDVLSVLVELEDWLLSVDVLEELILLEELELIELLLELLLSSTDEDITCRFLRYSIGWWSAFAAPVGVGLMPPQTSFRSSVVSIRL
jgi:hypothetical protein